MSDYEIREEMDVTEEDQGEVKEEKQKTKTVSFRLKEDTAEKIKEFIESMGGSKEDALTSLMSVYELHNSKSLIPDREKEIENFEFYVHKMVSAYVESLETCELAEEKIKANYEKDLTSKQKTITDLQEKDELNKAKLAEQKKELDEAKAKQKLAEKEAEDAKGKQASAEQKAADKVEIANMLQNQLKEATDKLAEYPTLKETESFLRGELAKAEQTIKDNKKDAEIAQERAVTAVYKEMDKAVAEANKEKDKALSDLEREKDKQIMELEVALSKAQTTADEKQKQLDKLEDKNDNLQTTIAELRSKIATLTAQNEFLEKQVEAKKNEK